MLSKSGLAFLSQRGVTSLRRLNIQVNNGTVTFQGTVSSFYERQLCISSHRVHGVYRVVDDLKVELPSKTSAATELLAEDCPTEVPTQTSTATGLASLRT